jgi:hypothetical protein
MSERAKLIEQELRRRFKKPKDALKALGLDASILKVDKLALDAKLRGRDGNNSLQEARENGGGHPADFDPHYGERNIHPIGGGDRSNNVLPRPNQDQGERREDQRNFSAERTDAQARHEASLEDLSNQLDMVSDEEFERLVEDRRRRRMGKDRVEALARSNGPLQGGATPSVRSVGAHDAALPGGFYARFPGARRLAADGIEAGFPTSPPPVQRTAQQMAADARDTSSFLSRFPQARRIGFA